jgi:hypothetical protein
MKADFSEFTYGFSLVSELASALECAAVSIFPSLIKEGQDGGGYDVEMGMGAVPLFLQFKLSEHLKTNNAKEAKHPSGNISAPYRRFQITSSKWSKQHALLLGLGAKHEHVYYCAPDFYTNEDLTYLWNNGYVSDGSVFVHPTEIGPISDDQRHAVCFNGMTLGADTCYLFSDPKPLKNRSVKALRGAIEAELRNAETPLRDLLPNWAKLLEEGRSAGEQFHREQVEAIDKIREERRLAALEEDGFGIQYSEKIMERQVFDGFDSIPEIEPFNVRSRVSGVPEKAIDPGMQALMKLGRTAATEFQTQMFVLQRRTD